MDNLEGSFMSIVSSFSDLKFQLWGCFSYDVRENSPGYNGKLHSSRITRL